MEHPVKALQLRCVENGAVYWTARTDECSLGNCADCDIQIHIKQSDSALSPSGAGQPRILATITFQNDAFCLIDQSEYNGNQLNGRNIWNWHPYPLKEGDRFSLAGNEFLVQRILDKSEEPPYPNTHHAEPVDVYGPPELFFENRILPLPLYGPPPRDFKKDDKDR